MKKQLTKFLFIFIAVVCFSITAFAQKSDDKKGERKPPTIIVPDKERKPKDDKQKDDDKKQSKIAIFVQEKVGIDL